MSARVRLADAIASAGLPVRTAHRGVLITAIERRADPRDLGALIEMLIAPVDSFGNAYMVRVLAAMGVETNATTVARTRVLLAQHGWPRAVR